MRRNIEQNFPDPLDLAVASVPDTQGFGATDLPAYPSSAHRLIEWDGRNARGRSCHSVQ